MDVTCQQDLLFYGGESVTASLYGVFMGLLILSPFKVGGSLPHLGCAFWLLWSCGIGAVCQWTAPCTRAPIIAFPNIMFKDP